MVWPAQWWTKPRRVGSTRLRHAARVSVAVDRERYAELAVASERVRIAREVHDIVAHSLSVMVALADGAALTLDRDPARAREAMSASADTGRTALAQMRQSLAVLRTSGEGAEGPQIGPDPGLGDLDPLLESVRGTGIQVSYRTSGSTHDLPAPLQLAVYRVVQEATTNTLKHALRATRVSVSIRLGQADLRVVVDDNGAPAAVSLRHDGPPGHGLLGMRERVTLHDGRLFAGPTSNGWRVSVWLPVPSGRSRR